MKGIWEMVFKSLIRLSVLGLLTSAVGFAQTAPLISAPNTSPAPSEFSAGTPDDVLTYGDTQLEVLKAQSRRLLQIRIELRTKLNKALGNHRQSYILNIQAQYDRATLAYHASREIEHLFHKKVDQYFAGLKRDGQLTEQLQALVPPREGENVALTNEASVPAQDEYPEYAPGGPVVEVDDPAPPELDTLEINVYLALERIRHAPEGVIPLLIQPAYMDINYGAFKGVQFKFEFGIPTVAGGNGNAYRATYDHWIAGVKIRVFGQDDGLSGGIYPQFGSENGGKFLYVPWLMTYENDKKKFAVTVNAGYQLGTNLDKNENPNIVNYGVGFGRPVTKTLAMMVAATFEKPVTGENHTTAQLYAVGARWAPKFLTKKIPGSVIFFNVTTEIDEEKYKHRGFRVGVQFYPSGSATRGVFGRKKPSATSSEVPNTPMQPAAFVPRR
jgi:hypothetical protein